MNPEVFIKAIPEILTQLLAFLLVFFILKKYAFGAIFNVLDERRKAIADSFSQIEQKKADVERLEKEYKAKLQNIDQEARQKIQQAIQEGTRIGQEIQEKARQDSLKQVERAKADIDQEILKARTVLRSQIVNLSTKMAEKIIRRTISREGDDAFNQDILKEVEQDILKEAGKV